MAGLSCGVLLSQAGKSVKLLESTDRVGGRVRSDVIEGFTLDVGFQVLLTAYPACQQMLDYSALRLRSFNPGALIRHGGRFTTLADPWRSPSQAFATALNPVGSIRDKFLIAKLRRQCCRGTLDDLYQRPAKSTDQYLHDFGFSDAMINEFFRPFLGGVFLDESLAVSSRMLEFVFRMFAIGDVSVPAEGMGAIPRQLADRMPRGSISLQSSVVKIHGNCVHLADGTSLAAKHLVVATESNAAARLLGNPELATKWNQTQTLYYATSHQPDGHKSLILGGDETGPIQTATVISNVAPEYACGDQALISVSLRPQASEMSKDLEHVDQRTRTQLKSWFGDSVSKWRLLQSYKIAYGVPQLPLNPVIQGVQPNPQQNLYVCGDHCETPSIQGAMSSGMRVANLILHACRGE